MKQLNSLLTTWQQRHKESWTLRLMLGWNEAIGELSQHLTLVSITQEYRLIIGAPSNEWMHELHFLSDQLIKKINVWLECDAVREIKFVRHTKKTRKFKPHTSKQTDHIPQQIVLSESQKRVLSSIEDAEFKTALIQFLGRCTQ